MDNNFQEIDISNSIASHFMKLGMLCTNKKVLPKWVGYLCFTIFNLQIFAIILKNAYYSFTDDAGSNSRFIKLFADLLTTSELVSYGHLQNFIIGVVFTTIYLLQILGIFVYITIKLRLKSVIPRSIQVYWSLLCYVHPLIFFFPIHCFSLEFLRTIKDGDNDASTDACLIFLFSFTLIINWSLALLPTNVFYLVIKTKDPLSSKNNFMLVKDLILKTFIPVFWLFMDGSNSVKVSNLAFTFVSSLISLYTIYYYLPYYHLEILIASAMLHASFMIMSLISLVTQIINCTGSEYGVYTVEIAWICLIPLVLRISYSCIWRALMEVILSSDYRINIHYLVHKRYVMKHFLKRRLAPHPEAKRYNKHYFYHLGKLTYMSHTSNFNVQESHENPKLILNRLITLMEMNLKAYKKTGLVKVTLANYYVKYNNSYLLANNIIQEVLDNTSDFALRLSVSRIRIDLQKKLFLEYSQKAQYLDAKTGLNIYGYIKAHQMNDKLTNCINLQVKHQLNFWTIFLSSYPDMRRLVEISTKIHSRKKKVRKFWNQLSRDRDPAFVNPLLIYGMYLSIAENDSIDSEKILDQYNNELIRLRKISAQDVLNNSTVFAPDTFQITMSGLRTQLGRILDCSPNISKVLGWDRKLAVGRSVTFLMSKFYRERHDGFLMRHYNTGHSRMLNETIPLPFMASNGYIIPVWAHIKMNPVVESGVSYIGLARPFHSSKRYLIIKDDGVIDSMTEGFAKDMNILDEKPDYGFNVNTLCPDFKLICDAFNYVHNSSGLKLSESPSAATPLKQQLGTLKSFKYPNTATETEKFTLNDLAKTTDRPLMANNKDEDTQFKLRPEASFTSRSVTERNTGKTPTAKLEETLSHIFGFENRARTIYENFTIAGSELAFYPQRSYEVDGNKINLFGETGGVFSDPIIYRVKIRHSRYGKDSVKVLSMEKTGIYNNVNPELGLASNASEHLVTGSSDDCNDVPNEKRMIRLYQKDEPKSPYFKGSKQADPVTFAVPKRIQTATEPTLSPKDNITTPLHKEDEANETMLSVVDEINGKDSTDRDVIRRSLRERKKTKNLTIQTSHVRYKLKDKQQSAKRVVDSADLRLNFAYSLDQEVSPRRNSYHKETSWEQPMERNSPVQKTTTMKLLEELRENKKLGEDSSVNMKSSVPINDQEPLQEENLLRKKLKRLKEKLNQPILNQNNRENSIASTYLSKGRKVQSLVIQALRKKSNKKSGRVYGYAFFGFVLLLIALVLFQLITSMTALDNLTEKSSVASKGYLRLDALFTVHRMSRGWEGVLRGILQIVNFDYDVSLFRNLTLEATLMLNQYNNDLRVEVSQMALEFQTSFYAKDTGIYDRASDGSLELAYKTSTFDAIQQIIERELRMASQVFTASVGANTIIPDLQFVMDNTLNDLFVSLIDTVFTLVDNLESTVTTMKDRKYYSLGVLIGISGLFIGASIKYLLVILKEAKDFTNVIFKLDIRDCEHIKTFLQRFQASLLTNIRDIEISEETLVDDKAKAKKYVKPSKGQREASMQRLQRYLTFHFAKLLPLYMILIAGAIIFTLVSLSTISKVENKQQQIQDSLLGMTKTSLVFTEILDLISQNNSTQVQNQPIEANFLSWIKDLSQYQAIINDFQDSSGNLPPLQQEIFFNYPCTKIGNVVIETPLDLYSSCMNISNGNGAVGLANMLSLSIIEMKYYYNVYVEGPKTEAYLVELTKTTNSAIEGILTVTAALWRLLYTTADENFKSNANDIEIQTIYYTAAMVAVGFLGAMFIWLRILKNIFKLENKDREILQLVPIQTLLKNRYIQSYILQTTEGDLEGIKSYLW